MNNFNPNKFNTISKANENRVNYDLRYSNKTGKFNLSDRMMDELGMQENGFNFHYDAENKTAFLSLVPQDDAVLMRGKSGDTEKGKHFTASRVRDVLDTLEMKAERMNLEEAGEFEGVTYYEIVPVEGSKDYDAKDLDESEDEESEDELDSAPELA